MSIKGGDAYSPRPVASLKERFLRTFLAHGKRNQSAKAKMQSSAAMTPCFDVDVKAPLNTRYKFVRTISVRVHTLDSVFQNHWEKLINNTLLSCHWDKYTIVLDDSDIHSPTAVGVFAKPIPYCDITNLKAVSISYLRFCYIRLFTNDASYLIQVPDTYQRDRLLHCLRWKINVRKYEKILFSATQLDVLTKELQYFVKVTLETPLYMDDTYPILLDMVSNLLVQKRGMLNSVSNEALIMTMAPLLEENRPSVEICNFFTKHCHACPRSRVVIDMFLPMVMRDLKHNVNYGQNIWQRSFVKEYLLALSMQNDGEMATRAFVRAAHGPLSYCPHLQMLNNLLSVCLSAIYESFSTSGSKEKESPSKAKEESLDPKPRLPLKSHENDLVKNQIARFLKNRSASHEKNVLVPTVEGTAPKLVSCGKDYPSLKGQKGSVKLTKSDWTPGPDTALVFVKILDEMSTFSDWLPGLAVLLQPVPFEEEVLRDRNVTRYLLRILKRIYSSGYDSALWCLVREYEDGWLQLVSPQNNLCCDGGQMFINITKAFLQSNNLKRIVTILTKTCLNALLLLALRGTDVMIEALCYALEYKVAVGEEEIRIVSTLKSTTRGNTRYERLCKRQAVMRRTGGPGQFILPPKSTDQDLQRFLTSVPCGNLKYLDLSLTQVSCKSAGLIARLPALQHLNLWSTLVRDRGLMILCESLNLESLNLCETDITDKSIIRLKDMSNLQHLNLNSTGITDNVYCVLMQCLPNLTHCDVSYTEANPFSATELARMQNNASSSAEAPRNRLLYKKNI